MSATELDELTSLIERVLPDPSGFAERLFQQMLARWTAAVPDAGTATAPIDIEAWLGQAPGSHRDRPDPTAGSLSDIYLLLAAALGACDCWGQRRDCTLCEGDGLPGWAQPDIQLFHELVGPEVARLSAAGLDDDNRQAPDHAGAPGPVGPDHVGQVTNEPQQPTPGGRA